MSLNSSKCNYIPSPNDLTVKKCICREQLFGTCCTKCELDESDEEESIESILERMFGSDDEEESSLLGANTIGPTPVESYSKCTTTFCSDIVIIYKMKK